jgi:hypothetical protein
MLRSGTGQNTHDALPEDYQQLFEQSTEII